MFLFLHVLPLPLLIRERERYFFLSIIYATRSSLCVCLLAASLLLCGSFVVTVFHPPPQSLMPSCGDWCLDDDRYTIGVYAACLLVNMLVLVFVFKYFVKFFVKWEQNFCCCYAVMDCCCNTMLLLKDVVCKSTTELCTKLCYHHPKLVYHDVLI